MECCLCCVSEKDLRFRSGGILTLIAARAALLHWPFDVSINIAERSAITDFHMSGHLFVLGVKPENVRLTAETAELLTSEMVNP